MQAREQLLNAWHFVGSCGIGRVLDADLKVLGFPNLRVVDASAIPDMTENAGPAGTTYMLAEFAAELIIAGDGEGGSQGDGYGTVVKERKRGKRGKEGKSGRRHNVSKGG